MEFHDHIWNHYEKCIQNSTNKPGIGSLICEIAVKISEILLSKTNARVVSVFKVVYCMHVLIAHGLHCIRSSISAQHDLKNVHLFFISLSLALPCLII